jgi:hypothetical protein
MELERVQPTDLKMAPAISLERQTGRPMGRPMVAQKSTVQNCA